MIIDALRLLADGKDIGYDITKNVMNKLADGLLSDIQIAAFLTGLRIKGETVEEITAAAEVMREKCIKTELNADNLIDIVGTGGDMSNSFNISTTSAFVIAAGGVPVAKHGNRASSSKSGSIDVLEACGINVDNSSEREKEIFKELNLCFMYAQNHHPAMQHAIKVRRELKFKTLFNIMGPLSNPAGAKSVVFGVFDGKLVNKLAHVISALGVKKATVIHGCDGLDEASICAETLVSELSDGKIKDYVIAPEDFGLKRSKTEDILGDSPQYNAEIIKNIFNLKENGPKKDIVLLNSGIAFYTCGKTSSIKEGVSMARNIIDSGLALDKFNKYVKITNEV